MSEAPRVRVGCPECGGMMLFDRRAKSYVCQSCGVTMTRQELLEDRKRLFTRIETEEERRERERREYLKWWLSSKKRK